MKKLILWTILLSIAFLLFTIFLFIYKQPFLIFSQIDSGLFSDFGEFIGGTLGIVLTGVTVYLLYMTFTAQKNQLDLQKIDAQLKFVDLQYDQIIKDIEDIRFIGKQGTDALYAWNKSHGENPNNVFNTLNFILHTFSNHIVVININQVLSTDTKEQLLIRAYLMFHSKIVWPVLQHIYDDPSFKGHTDKCLYKNFNKLTKEAYDYLIDNNRKKLGEPTDGRVIKIRNEEV